jgi:hypothetical protein
MEKYISNHLTSYLVKMYIIDKNQLGFQGNYSTEGELECFFGNNKQKFRCE